MIKFLLIFIYFSTILPITGLELAEKMAYRLKPDDLRSEKTMMLTNKKGYVKS